MRGTVLGLIFISVMATACGNGRSLVAATVATTRSASPPTAKPRATPTADDQPIIDTVREIAAAPVLTGSTGWLIYTRGPELFIADLATGNEQQLTHDATAAGYAGDAVIDGMTWLYYFSITNASQGAVVLTRRRLSGGAEERLFTFRRSDVITVGMNVAAVSPDGTRVAYTASDGLHVRTLASGDDRLLLANMPRARDGSGAGFHYDAPAWSPAGRWLLVYRGADPPANIQNAGPVVLDPSDPASARDVPLGGWPAWSPDGQRLCGETRATVSDLALYTLNSGEVRNLTSARSADSIVPRDFGACTWLNDGELAAEYNVGGLQLRIAVLDTTGRQIATLDAGAVLSGAIWLPNGSGVIVSTLAGTPLEPQSSAVMLDGSWRRIPDSPGTVVGTIRPSR
jgi:hypothetical protein